VPNRLLFSPSRRHNSLAHTIPVKSLHHPLLGSVGRGAERSAGLNEVFSTLFSSHNKSIGFLCTHYFSHTINLQYKSAKDLPNAHFFFRQMGDECSWRGKGHRDFQAHRATPSASCSTTTPYAHGLRLAHDVSRKFDAK
jgi:hypothetical protein